MRRSLVAALSAAALLLLAACGEGDDDAGGGGTDSATGSSETQSITVGVIPIVDVAPIYLGVEQGFFEQRGLDVTLQTAQGGAAIVPAVIAGEFDFGFSNITSLLIAQTQGLPLKVVAAGDSTTGKEGEDFAAVVVPEGSAITGPADLAGKTVAVNTLNNIGTTTISKVVDDAGGDASTINFVELPFPDMPAALAEGRIEAAWGLEPFLTIMRNQGATPVTWNYAETDPNLVIAAYFTTQQKLDEDPELVEAFTEAMNESLQYAQDNPDAAREVLGSYTQIDPAVAEALILPRWPTEIDAAAVQLLADLAEQDGLVDTAPDVEALLP
ncbi:MAG TPA: ABC transporter substrate-binding protein [Acidothermales bacterium]